MEPNEALGIAAQVAVTLAGFAGIVVVFLPESVHQWSRVDRFRLRLLLSNVAVRAACSFSAPCDQMTFNQTMEPTAPLLNHQLRGRKSDLRVRGQFNFLKLQES
jgi:hypothetical protein